MGKTTTTTTTTPRDRTVAIATLRKIKRPAHVANLALGGRNKEAALARDVVVVRECWRVIVDELQHRTDTIRAQGRVFAVDRMEEKLDVGGRFFPRGNIITDPHQRYRAAAAAAEEEALMDWLSASLAPPPAPTTPEQTRAHVGDDGDEGDERDGDGGHPPVKLVRLHVGQ